MAQIAFDARAGELVETLARPCHLSIFRSLADPAPQTITLPDFLAMVRDGEARTLIIKLRSEPDVDRQKSLKKMLPAVTVSGVFSGGHQQAHMVEHSGLICLDFDLDRNPLLGGCADQWRDKLAEDEFVKASFLSARGNGVATICRIEGERHSEAFDALLAHFKASYGLAADPSCRDPSRLRFLSWDPEARENDHARLFRRYSLVDAPAPAEATPTPAQEAPAPDPVPLAPLTPTRREELLSALERLSPDNRDTWLQVGMALQSEATGLEGFNLWERWSQIADGANKWNEKDARRVWQSFGRRHGTNIETLFALAYKAGWKGPPPVETPTGILPTVQADVWMAADEAPRDPVLEGVFDSGEFCEVIAPSKCRKSFFILQLAICVATGRAFLRWKMPKSRRVLLVNFEVTSAWQHRRIKRMSALLGVPAAEASGLLVANCRGLNLQDPVTAVLNTIRAQKPTLVILDPLYMLHQGDENAAVDMIPLIRRLSALMAETGAALVIVHHDAKGRAGDRDIRDRGSGSGVFSRSCDARLTLTPHADSDDLVCVDVMARNHPPQPGFVCRMDSGAFIEDGAEFEPATTRNSGRKIKNATVAQDGADSVAKEIATAGPFDSDAVEAMLKDRCGKKNELWKGGKKLLKDMAARGEVIMIVARQGQKEMFGPVNCPPKWRRIGIDVEGGCPQKGQGVPNDAGTPLSPPPVPTPVPPPVNTGGDGGQGCGVSGEAFVPEEF